MHFRNQGLLAGSWVVINGLTSRVTVLISHIRGLITLLIATHEPPSCASQRRHVNPNPQTVRVYQTCFRGGTKDKKKPLGPRFRVQG